MVHCIKEESIPAASTRVIMAKAVCPDGSYVLENKQLVHPSLLVSDAVVNVTSGQVPVVCVNSSGVEVRLKKNASVAEIGVFYESETSCQVDVSKDDCTTKLRPIAQDDVADLVDSEFSSGLLGLLNRYRDVVALKGEKLGFINLVKASIPTGNNRPVFVKQYPLAHKVKSELNAIVDEMLEDNIVRPSSSPWNSPIILVKKKDGSFRPCVDFRKLNAITTADKFPLPRIQELLQSLHGAKYFSNLDLQSSYWQTALHEDDKQKTAFSTDKGHFEFERMPFGLRNAPSIFSRLMSVALAGLIGLSVFVYLDDIVVISKTQEEHFRILESVFCKLREANLRLSLKKCKFFKPKIKFLGHEINSQGIAIHPDHIDPIKNYPCPKNKKDVQRFVGFFAYFRSFVQNFADIVSPITDLLKNENKFAWNEEQERAFNKIKGLLLSASILKYPDFSQKFYLFTDASNTAIGAVLMQKDNDKLKPIAFSSRSLSNTERRYSTTKREALAIVAALKNFRHLVLGYEIEVFTDHQPLRVLFQSKLDTGAIGRWALIVQEFSLKITYIKGKANILADTLSRIYSQALEEPETGSEENDIIDFVAAIDDAHMWSKHELMDEQRKDEFCNKILDFLEVQGRSGKKPKIKGLNNFCIVDKVLMYRKVVKRCGTEDTVCCTVIPKSLEAKAILYVHASAWSGHLGSDRTWVKANRYFFFRKMRTKINKFINNCAECQQAYARDHVKVTARKYPLPNKPWERVATDFLGPLPLTTNGNRYVLVLTDFLTRYSVFYALPDRSTDTVIRTFKTFFNTYDCPEVLISDNAAEFSGSMCKEMCRAYGVRKLEVTPYHPASNGLVERINSRIVRMLKVYCVEKNDSNNWDEFLEEINVAVNSSFNKSLGDTPFFILYNFDKSSFFSNDEERKGGPFYAYDDYFRSMQYQRKLVSNYFRENLNKEMEKYLEVYNAGKKDRVLQVGQRVYMRYVAKKNEPKKLAKKWSGPLVVEKVLSTSKYILAKSSPRKTYTVHIDNILSRNSILEQNLNNPSECD